MLRSSLLLFFSILYFIRIDAQDVYMPRDVKEAYARHERSTDGSPGKNYWQNGGRYQINVTVDPPNRTINGSEEIIYKNNGPITLDYLNYRLIQNIHRPGVQRNRDADTGYLTSGIHIDSFAVNGLTQSWTEPQNNPTYKWVNLPKPLASHDSVRIFFKWHYDISVKAVREGMLDSSSCFLAYFYPRVAVVDDYNWWDWMDFTDQQEFYNDFNDYILNVTVPKNYIVWATGTLQNAKDVLQPEYEKRLTHSFTSDSVIKIAGLPELLQHKITRQNNNNTWQWTASNVSDVAFGVSDHFIWDASSVAINDKNTNRVSVQALYTDTAISFHNAVAVGRHAVKWFSNNWPGVAYPYPKTTISSGFEDMEYPMMVNDIPDRNIKAAALVEEHEIAHTWFPFYMGINESRYAFMDEGWATAFELLINREDEGIVTADSIFKKDRVQSWIADPTGTHDLPVITPADALKGNTYGDNAYGKPALAYHALKDMLGDMLFKKCLHQFMDRWNGKHPIPWDFFNTFNNVSGKNLNWFWNNWFFSNNYIDIAIDTITKTTNGYSTAIKNTGGFAIPLNVRVNYTDGSSEARHYSPDIWKKNEKLALLHFRTAKKIKSIELVNGIFMDANEANNVFKL